MRRQKVPRRWIAARPSNEITHAAAALLYSQQGESFSRNRDRAFLQPRPTLRPGRRRVGWDRQPRVGLRFSRRDADAWWRSAAGGRSLAERHGMAGGRLGLDRGSESGSRTDGRDQPVRRRRTRDRRRLGREARSRFTMPIRTTAPRCARTTTRLRPRWRFATAWRPPSRGRRTIRASATAHSSRIARRCRTSSPRSFHCDTAGWRAPARATRISTICLAPATSSGTAR